MSTRKAKKRRIASLYESSDDDDSDDEFARAFLDGDSKGGEKTIDERKTAGKALKDLPQRRMMIQTPMTNPMPLKVVKRSMCKRKGELYLTTMMTMTMIE